MPNPFSSVLTAALKQKYKDAIDALIAFGEVPCLLYFPPDKFEDCPNCSVNNVGAFGPNPYINGNTGSYKSINCTVCSGTGKRPVEKSDSISLIVIFDKKKFFNFGGAMDSGVDAQTISRLDDTHQQIMSCSHAYLDTNTGYASRDKFTRVGESKLAGLGENRYIITNWAKA